MTTNFDITKARPFSADVSRLTKVRLQSSNCPTIVKHEITSPTESMQLFGSPTDKALLDRPRTANSTTKMKLAFLQSIRPISSPHSAVSMRPQSGGMNSTINFDFISAVGKASSGKFKDKSKIKPMKKLNTDGFHNIIYKVKQQKELLEKDINRMEIWQRDFKENDIWSTPQAAIIDSIMKMNARANPDGSISKYLQSEKEKEDTLRSSKKFQRPLSSYSGRMNRNPKSVKDFFKGEDNEEAIIEEILSTKNPYYTQYENNKRRITEKINTYVDNYSASNNVLKPSNKPQSSQGSREQAKNWKPYEASGSNLLQVDEDNVTKSISEIVESHEGSEASPSNLAQTENGYNKVSQGFQTVNDARPRPFSAKIALNTANSPKNFAPAVLRNFYSAQGPVVIHSRPHTAKNMRIASPGSVITNNMIANGEGSTPSISGVKYIPFRLEGQKLGIGAENIDVNTYNDMIVSAKGMKFVSPNKTATSSRSMHGFFPSSNTFKVAPSDDFESGRAVSRGGQGRLRSAKRDSRPNTASSHGLESGLSVGKVNIDGQYLSNFGNRTPISNA